MGNVLIAIVALIVYGFWHDYRVRQKRKDCRTGKHRWSRWRAVDTTYYGDKDIWQCHCHECGIMKQEVSRLQPKKNRKLRPN